MGHIDPDDLKKDKSQNFQLLPLPHAQVLAENAGFAVWQAAAVPPRRVGEECSAWHLHLASFIASVQLRDERGAWWDMPVWKEPGLGETW